MLLVGRKEATKKDRSNKKDLCEKEKKTLMCFVVCLDWIDLQEEKVSRRSKK
jgi:hypothetical protein